MEFLLMILSLVLIVIIAVWLYIVRQGDAELKFIVEQRTDFGLVDSSEKTATFATKVPFVNRGPQDGTIMDAFPRHLLPKEQYDKVKIHSQLTLAEMPRDDGYWEAIIIFAGTGGSIIITVEFTAKEGNIREALSDMVDMPIEIVYQVVGRKNYYITKARLVMTADEIKRALHLAQQDRGE